ncbi:MAG: Trm112 family protein [Proteobacteria bacterium]|nr:Trm112 family protein [Pseudomonadota bacterium]
MKKKLLKILVCPVCKGQLQYRSRQNELVCERDRLAYPVRKNVPVLLRSDARKLDDDQ